MNYVITPSSSDLSASRGELIPHADLLVRELHYGDNVRIRYVAETKDVAQRLTFVQRSFTFAVETLATALTSLKRARDLDGVYIAHLLGQTSEAEYEQLALDLAYQPIEIEPAELVGRIRVLFALTSVDFTPIELADVFQTTEAAVERAVHELKTLNTAG